MLSGQHCSHEQPLPPAFYHHDASSSVLLAALFASFIPNSVSPSGRWFRGWSEPRVTVFNGEMLRHVAAGADVMWSRRVVTTILLCSLAGLETLLLANFFPLAMFFHFYLNALLHWVPLELTFSLRGFPYVGEHGAPSGLCGLPVPSSRLLPLTGPSSPFPCSSAVQMGRARAHPFISGPLSEFPLI